MNQKIKKLFFKLLVNDFVGAIICAIYPNDIPDLRWKPYKFRIKRDGVDKKLAASIYFGFYEAGEIRFIHKYFDGNADVVELGGSMGIVSAHIASKQAEKKRLITIEANPFLEDTLKHNVNAYRNGMNECIVLNNAIGYSSDEVELHLTGNSTETRVTGITDGKSKDKVVVKSIKLSDVIEQYHLHDFTLVSDIEGAEAELLKAEMQGLARCREIFIELHESSGPGKTFTVESLIKQIVEIHRFALIDRNGPVVYFRRNSTGT